MANVLQINLTLKKFDVYHSITLPNYVEKNCFNFAWVFYMEQWNEVWLLHVCFSYFFLFSENGHDIEKTTAVCSHIQMLDICADNFDMDVYIYNSHLHRGLLFNRII